MEHTLFPCRLEVDGESEPDCPLFTATPRANGGRGGGSSTWGGEKAARSLLECSRTRFGFCPRRLPSPLSKLAGVIPMLGGSLVRVSLHPRTVPASSATLSKNAAPFAATAVRISAHCGPEEPRESRAERYCEAQNSVRGRPKQASPNAARFTRNRCGPSLSPPLRKLHILVRAPWQDLCPFRPFSNSQEQESSRNHGDRTQFRRVSPPSSRLSIFFQSANLVSIRAEEIIWFSRDFHARVLSF